MKSKTKTWLKIALFIVFFVFLDQISKYWATASLKGKNSFVLIPNILSFTYLNGGNDGAAWGLLSGKKIIFIIFTIIAVILICKFISNVITLNFNSSLNKSKALFMQYSMALLIAGAIGNLIDRIVYGTVTDFICFDFIKFPIFNVADCYVTCSCVVLAIICIFKLSEDEFNSIFTLKRNK